jgi:hypothetical protein
MSPSIAGCGVNQSLRTVSGFRGPSAIICYILQDIYHILRFGKINKPLNLLKYFSPIDKKRLKLTFFYEKRSPYIKYTKFAPLKNQEKTPIEKENNTKQPVRTDGYTLAKR